MKERELKKHEIAVRKLELIRDNVFEFIKKNLGKVSEYDVCHFIEKEFKKENLIPEKKHRIMMIATKENTSLFHYFPKKQNAKIITKNSLILIDIWAKLNEKRAPFADLTWMAYTGKQIPPKIEKTFRRVIKARDLVLDFIVKNLKNRNLPLTYEIDKIARDYFKKFNLERNFPHGTGHSLGFEAIHGKYFRFGKKSKGNLKIGIPFTIEPGLYFKNDFGVRTEIDCYITKDWRLKITSFCQKEIIKI